MTVRLAIDGWSPELGAAFTGDDHLLPAPGDIDVTVEAQADGWAPRSPAASVAPAHEVRFVDGVRRVDARVWMTGDDGTTRQGLAVSYAAGAVRCDGAAVVERVEVRRALFGCGEVPPITTDTATWRPCTCASDAIDVLLRGVQERLATLEQRVTDDLPDAPLTVVDGPLRGRGAEIPMVGYVKTHHASYLPPELSSVVAALGPGQRTPLFLVQSASSRFSWYLRLPFGTGHPWAGVVRCEVAADRAVTEAVALADLTTASLPRFASEPHKDPRAPQNLYPIAGLERHCKRLLGDAAHLERVLRAAA